MKQQMKISTLLFFLCLTIGNTTYSQTWRNPDAPIDKRVDDLLSRMTLDEKISYCGSVIPGIDRLGIPDFVWYGEALHGIIDWNCTQFPQNIAMGSTWNPDLMFDVATAISNEARALKNMGRKEVMMFSPTVNMARDPRWGRNEECYSEDPFLMSEMARMYIRGMQGNDPKYTKTVTTVKHFVANNVDKRREYSHSLIGPEDLYEYYFPAYKTCIVDEEATGVMTALNGLNGVPCSANDWLINGVLRKQWGFKGYVIADWAAVQGIEKRMHFAQTQEEAAAMAIRAGLDQECFRHKTKPAPMVQALKPAIEKGLLSENELDVSVRRLLRLRFMTGDFDDATLNPYSKIPASVLECETHKKLALKAAEQSIVLLKNNEVLPLSKDIEHLAVIGPFANRCWLGIYSGNPQSKISPLDGIIKSAKGEVSFAEGCTVKGDISDDDKINEAIALAKKSDYVILVVGNDESTATENVDRKNLKLPGKQHQLIKAVQAVNKNIILVLVPSGPTNLTWEQENIPGIICAWPNGQEQGTALAHVLYGEVNPGGKLTATWVKSANNLPHMHDYNIRRWKDDYGPEISRTYMYSTTKPLYPFGYGLSYTKFKIENVKLSKSHMKEMDDVMVNMEVLNIGKMDGDEIVQVYVRDVKTNRIAPTKALKGFKRVHIPAGKSKSVSIKLPYEAFSHYDKNTHKFKVESGTFEIMIGQSSENIVAVKAIELTGGDIPEVRVGEKSGYFNANDKNRTKKWDHIYENNIVDDHKTKNTDNVSYKWIEYEILFTDPGFYVNTWDAELHFKYASKDAVLETSMEGLKINTYKLDGKRKLPIKIPIPPEYGTPVRLKIKTLKGKIKHASIQIIPPGDKKPFVIEKIHRSSMNQ
ncbi:glycoside hydrolase family 3 C-terminal domain-containing protein [Saccharicrinis fermentans]|uniref:Thermostable beta-glucosidase B n=1 Tax=Saccharicrinis fermentans DSM 9555 = JCM 21142 TaxID=869213 RepID=W7XW52_9BACT|nr:glycoside hydrolase family 3 C-terminal domain-containing protein [Saccharicrinis fermentans]GAF02500.1 thermostable beta-glucosidase B [Saccharicrinis fermentans DSM 9555 = JCM 21142]